MLHEPKLLQPTDAELRAEHARLHAKNQELETELESVKTDFHNRGLVNQLLEIIEDHRMTGKKLEDIIHDANRFENSLRKDYKYAKSETCSPCCQVAGRSQPAQGAKRSGELTEQDGDS